LFDDDCRVQLVLQTLQQVSAGHDMTSTRINEGFRFCIKENAMTSSGIELPPNDHDGVFVDTILESVKLSVPAGA
jgi:hypothetical protein